MSVLADQVAPTDLLARLDQAALAAAGRPPARRWALAAAAIACAVLAVLGARGALHLPRPSVIHPVVHPPKVIRLADVATAAPGRALMAVTLAPVRDRGPDTYVLVPGRDDLTRLPAPQHGPVYFSQHLSGDGTRLMQQTDTATAPRLEILDLRTGTRNRLSGLAGYCPRLSPDHRTVAMWAPSGMSDPLALVDVRTSTVHDVPQAWRSSTSAVAGCGSVGWSPDGRLLAAPAGEGTNLLDLQGQVVTSLPMRYVVNGAQSWSPDGTRLLVYDRATGSYLSHALRTGEETELGDSALLGTPMGWTGARVVWLTGAPGDQRLVTTDEHGRDERLWTRFDVGDRFVETVSWSASLAGA
jgi:hypothetical protein